jgi:hypothetical protein
MKFEKIKNKDLRRALIELSHDRIKTGVTADNILFITKVIARKSPRIDNMFVRRTGSEPEVVDFHQLQAYVNSLPRCVVDQILYDLSNRLDHSSDWKVISRLEKGCVEDVLDEWLTVFDVLRGYPRWFLKHDDIGWVSKPISADVFVAKGNDCYDFTPWSHCPTEIATLAYFVTHILTYDVESLRSIRNAYYQHIRETGNVKEAARLFYKHAAPVVRNIIMQFHLTSVNWKAMEDLWEAWKNGRC